jgi:hypothetical protein
LTAAPTIKLDTTSALVGKQVSISGTGFTPNSEVKIKFDYDVINNAMPPTITADDKGSFTNVKFVVPESMTGSHLIQVIDSQDKILASTTITIDVPMSQGIRVSLIAYFFVLIVASGYLLVYHWQLTDQQNIMEQHPEIRYILLAGVFGLMGSSIHGVSSLTVWAGHQKLGKSWGWWYLVRPPIGTGLAIIIYFVLRAGLLSGNTAQFSYYGVAAISAMAGLSTEQTMAKLRDVLDKLFGIEATKKGNKAEDPPAQ